MKIISKTILCFVLLIGLASQISAQKSYNFKEGVIQYKIEAEGMPEMEGLLAGTTFNIYVQDKNSKVDIAFMGGFAKLQMINNIKTKLYTFLMDIPTIADKTAIDVDGFDSMMKDLDMTKDINKAPKKEDVKITYNKNNKKKIAKYSCYEAKVKVAGSDEYMTVYVTDKIRSEALGEFQKTFSNMQGFPLEFTLSIAGMKFRVTAQDVIKKTIAKEVFEVPSYYKNKSLKDFKQEMEDQFGKDGDKNTFGL